MAFLSRRNQSAADPNPLPVLPPPKVPPLPAPDRFGNYWAGQRPHGPAVFVSGSESCPVRPGKFFASTGGDCGVLVEPGGIRYFDTAAVAWDALHTFLTKA